MNIRKIELFCKDIEDNRKDNKKLRIQIVQQFKQNQIDMINNKMDMFQTSVNVGNTFAFKQNIRELKKLIFRSKKIQNQKRQRLKLNQIIKKQMKT